MVIETNKEKKQRAINQVFEDLEGWSIIESQSIMDEVIIKKSDAE